MKSMIKRSIEKSIRKKLKGGKAILLMGARQTGKSTTIKMILNDKPDVLWLNGDTTEAQDALSEASATKLKLITKGYSILVIDEAQEIQDIGKKIKIFTDLIPEIKVIATGSSSFELANKTSESLTGRKWEMRMDPISFAEMTNHHGFLKEKHLLENRLIYGYYPEIVTNEGDEKELLALITNSYLYKDLLLWSNIRNSDSLIKLLRALALQIGSEVSTNELSKLVGIDRGTIDRYIELLEKSYVIFRLPSFSRNQRNELKKSKKIYFFDTGIRNAIISNFSPINLRNDVGALWENFLIAERIKKLNLSESMCGQYFWRTTTQVEIDYIEEYDGVLNAFEFKWNPLKSRNKIPSSFSEAYPKSTFTTITPQNFEDFVL